MTGAVVLAAGAGRRLGGRNKALLAAADTSFLGQLAATARAAGVAEIVVVIGPPHGEATCAEAARLGLAVTWNPAPERGMASSVALGFAAAVAGFAAPAAFLWPVDHARVAAATLVALAGHAGASRWVVPTYRARRGHPPLIGRALWSALVGAGELAGGARAVRAAHPDALLEVEVDDPFVVRDVDRPEDLQ